MKHGRRQWLWGVGASGLSACAPGRTTAAPAALGPVDLIVRNALVITGDPQRPRAEAVAVRGAEVVAVGTHREVAAWIGPSTRIIDLVGGTVTPGLGDGHCHLAGLGQAAESIDLRNARSIEEVVARAKAGAPPTGWITGRGWDQNLWAGDGAMPTHVPLSEAFGARPVWLRRIDGHAGWANQAALAAAGVDGNTAAPAGGEILRLANGQPSGVLVDAAMDLMKIPAPSTEALRRWIVAGARQAIACGLTQVHDMGVSSRADHIYRDLVAKGELPLRVVGYADVEWFRSSLVERAPDAMTADVRYALRGVKLYADGALGSRGAALLQDYADRPGHRGLMQYAPQALQALCEQAARGGWQVATHAIGDAANRAVLDIYRNVLSTANDPDPRWRIEHCQIVAPEDIPRFASEGVIASMQPTHATSDMPWVEARVGAERLAGAYAWRSLLASGAHLCFGSDFPVERPEPVLGLFAAVTRTDREGNPRGGWGPQQRLSLDEAIAAMTAGVAYAGHRERWQGRLRPGARADLSCFAEAFDEARPATIGEARPVATIVEGRVVWEQGTPTG